MWYLFWVGWQSAWWSHRYNARTKSEGAVVRSPNQPKIFFLFITRNLIIRKEDLFCWCEYIIVEKNPIVNVCVCLCRVVLFIASLSLITPVIYKGVSLNSRLHISSLIFYVIEIMATQFQKRKKMLTLEKVYSETQENF